MSELEAPYAGWVELEIELLLESLEGGGGGKAVFAAAVGEGLKGGEVGLLAKGAEGGDGAETKGGLGGGVSGVLANGGAVLGEAKHGDGIDGGESGDLADMVAGLEGGAEPRLEFG